MKNKIIVMISLIFLSCSVVAQELPKNWYFLEDKTENEQGEINKQSEQSLGSYTGNILDVYENALTAKTDQPSQLNWELGSLVTDLAISKKGIFGLSTVSAKSAVEITWTKVAPKASLVNTETEVIYELGEKELNNSDEFINDLALNLKKSGKLSKVEEFKKHLKTKLDQTMDLMSNISADSHTEYTPDSFRIEINLDTAGKILPYATAGIGYRIQLDWKFTPGKVVSGKKLTAPQFTKLVRNLLEDISYAAAKSPSPKGFSLKKIGIGIGYSKKGVLGIGTSTIGAVGILFLNRKVVTKPAVTNLSTDENVEVIADSADDKKSFLSKLFHVKRNRIRKGLVKSLKIANFFTSLAEKRQSLKWEVSKIKTVFTLSQSGIFGLRTTGRSSSLTMIYVKNK